MNEWQKEYASDASDALHLENGYDQSKVCNCAKGMGFFLFVCFFFKNNMSLKFSTCLTEEPLVTGHRGQVSRTADLLFLCFRNPSHNKCMS